MIACIQLWLSREQAKSDFEDDMVREYRQLVTELPIEGFLGGLPEGGLDSYAGHFYRYFDLCNEQAFLHEQGRVRPETWVFWEEGITVNLQREAFARAWFQKIEPKVRPEEFSELRRLIARNPKLVELGSKLQSEQKIDG